jgi:hypothetical protein
MDTQAPPNGLFTIWLLIGFFFLVWGLFRAFGDLDIIWERYEQRRRSQGFTNLEQTPEWESRTRWGGCVTTVCGLLLVIMALSALFTGSPPSFTSSQSRGQAWVDGTPVPTEEFERQFPNH